MLYMCTDTCVQIVFFRLRCTLWALRASISALETYVIICHYQQSAHVQRHYSPDITLCG